MSEYIVDESKPFGFTLDGQVYTATVRYYSNGDCDVELDKDDASGDVYDAAWEQAEKLGLIAEHGDGFDVPNYGDNV